jgi:hypothetical protein
MRMLIVVGYKELPRQTLRRREGRIIMSRKAHATGSAQVPLSTVDSGRHDTVDAR